MIRLKRVLAAALTCLLVGILAMPVRVYADSSAIRNIVIYIALNQDGSADITENWDVTVTSGTEWYLVQGNLGKIEISDFSVMDENGTVFEYEENWDVDRTIEEKAGKCGILRRGGSQCELCWGVGNYGNHVFSVSYHMTNFVKGFDDYCGFNQRLINDKLSSAPEEIHVMITKPDTELTTADVGVWAFGYEGTIYVENGVIEADSSSALSENDYVTIMCRFPRDMFDTGNVIDGSFEQMRERAFEGSDYSHDSDSSGGGPLDAFLIAGFLIGMTSLLIISVCYFVRNNKKNSCPTTFEEERAKFAARKPKKPYQKLMFWVMGITFFLFSPIFGILYFVWVWSAYKENEVKVSQDLSGKAYSAVYLLKELTKSKNYYRDIPLDCFIPAYYATGKYTGRYTTENNILGAYILLWLQQGYVEIRNERKEGLGGVLGKEVPSVILKTLPNTDVVLEKQLFEMLQSASGGDNILQENEMYRWSKKNYTKVTKLLEKYEKYGKTYMRECGYMGEIPSSSLWGVVDKSQDVFTESGRKQLHAVKGLQNFLKDFTLIDERLPQDVVLWDQYMIAAQMFGMATQVAEKFKSIYPDYFEKHATYYNGFSSAYMTIDSISRASTSGVSAGGGGGGSSSCGGGGSSGGGSGGGSR